jgi:hypothetical protein
MANTYTLIEAKNLVSTTASITFTSIPQTYTDLLLKVSARSNYANPDNMVISYNSNTSSYTFRYIQGDGATAYSGNGSTFGYVGNINGNAATASTFGNSELYIPNYTSANYKSASIDSVDENNATSAYAGLTASRWSNTAAITSINLKPQNGTLWQIYSSFYLYGISNS